MIRHRIQLVLVACLSLWFSSAAAYIHECQEHLPPKPPASPAAAAAEPPEHDHGHEHEHDGPAGPGHGDSHHDCRVCQFLALSLAVPTPPPALPVSAAPRLARFLPPNQSAVPASLPFQLLARGPPSPHA